MKIAALILLYVLSIVAAAEFSARSTMNNQLNGVEANLAQTQGMLAFNHLQRYRELESDLSKGCNAAVLEKLKISAANESKLLSLTLKDHPGGWLENYVTKRSPSLVPQLATYSSPYGDTWKEPKCD